MPIKSALTEQMEILNSYLSIVFYCPVSVFLGIFYLITININNKAAVCVCVCIYISFFNNNLNYKEAVANS